MELCLVAHVMLCSHPSQVRFWGPSIVKDEAASHTLVVNLERGKTLIGHDSRRADHVTASPLCCAGRNCVAAYIVLGPSFALALRPDVGDFRENVRMWPI